jgi:hypothetical protein
MKIYFRLYENKACCKQVFTSILGCDFFYQKIAKKDPS